MRNANDELREHTCTDNFYKFSFNMVITDGVKSLCDKFECWWFADIIASYQSQLKLEEFQVWTLRKTGSSAIVTCTDGNDKILVSQNIAWTDFQADEATIWVEAGEVLVGLLPSEH